MNPLERLAIPTPVMARQVGDETVILNLATGTYFGLDPVGTRMWQLIGEGRTMGEICESLLAEFEVTRETLERDVAALLDDLRAQGLVTAAEHG